MQRASSLLMVAAAVVALAGCTTPAADDVSEPQLDPSGWNPDPGMALEMPYQARSDVRKTSMRGLPAESFGHIAPGLTTAQVRAALGPPSRISRRAASTDEASWYGRPLPPLRADGDDWHYERRWEERFRTPDSQGDIELVSQAVTVSFGPEGKVVDCRVFELRTGPSRPGLLNEAVRGRSEFRCAALKD
jgi:hypothetical protein